MAIDQHNIGDYIMSRERMDDLTAVAIAEGFEPCDDESKLQAAWQHLIDTGLAWRLQGWFGRTAASLIESGVCVAHRN
jgi:hypothetical protein